jgi:hypothetical protein
MYVLFRGQPSAVWFLFPISRIYMIYRHNRKKKLNEASEYISIYAPNVFGYLLIELYRS